jgi:hypothetical protein
MVCRRPEQLIVARELLIEALSRRAVVSPDPYATIDEVEDLAERHMEVDNSRFGDIEELLSLYLDVRQSTDVRLVTDDLQKLHEIIEIFGRRSLAGLRHYRREISIREVAVSWGYLSLVYGWSVIGPDTHPRLYTLALIVDGDIFKRERHGDGVGYHYHLLDGSKRRTDIALTFCRDQLDCCPGVWYSHAERGKAVKANPQRWALGRRQRVSNCCVADAAHLRSSFVAPPKEAQWLVNEHECLNNYKRP